MSNVAVVAPAGQAVRVEGIPVGTTVLVNGQQVSAAQDGAYPVPRGQASTLQVRRGNAILFQAQVPALEGNQVHNVRYVESARYEPGTADFVRNQAAKGKLAMSLFGIGSVVGLAAALAKLSRRG